MTSPTKNQTKPEPTILTKNKTQQQTLLELQWKLWTAHSVCIQTVTGQTWIISRSEVKGCARDQLKEFFPVFYKIFYFACYSLFLFLRIIKKQQWSIYIFYTMNNFILYSLRTDLKPELPIMFIFVGSCTVDSYFKL